MSREPGPRTVILFGGGLDSAAMVEMQVAIAPCAQPLLLFFDYKQKARNGELASLEYFTKKYSLESLIVAIPDGVVPDSPLTTQSMAKQHAQNYIPGRNMIFASLAYAVAVRVGARYMHLGASPADATSVYWDARQDFCNAFNDLTRIGYGATGPKLGMPLVRLDRETYLRLTLEKEPALFEVSFSCYESTTTVECGECTHCRIKQEMKVLVTGRKG